MSKREQIEFLSDIFESANRIRDYINGMAYEDFLRDLKTRDAVLRNLEVIGEAAKYIDDEHRVAYPEIPWKEMAGMRDKLIHHYFGVNFEIVWTIINDELPGVREKMEVILKEIGRYK
jgi:uncharacterized protein with HEPN domain